MVLATLYVSSVFLFILLVIKTFRLKAIEILLACEFVIVPFISKTDTTLKHLTFAMCNRK